MIAINNNKKKNLDPCTLNPHSRSNPLILFSPQPAPQALKPPCPLHESKTSMISRKFILSSWQRLASRRTSTIGYTPSSHQRPSTVAMSSPSSHVKAGGSAASYCQPIPSLRNPTCSLLTTPGPFAFLTHSIRFI